MWSKRVSYVTGRNVSLLVAFLDGSFFLLASRSSRTDAFHAPLGKRPERRGVLAYAEKCTTLRIDLPSCIKSNASLMSSSGIVCVTNGASWILSFIASSTIPGS